MKFLSFILILFLSHLVQASSLEVGQSQFFKASPNAKIKVTPAKLVEILEEPDGIRIKAIQPGSLLLEIDSATTKIKIFRSGTNDFYQDLKLLTKDMLGPKVRLVNGMPQVHGPIHRLSDIKKFVSHSEKWGRVYELKAQLDQDLWAGYLKLIKERLGSIGIQSFHMGFDPYPYVEIPDLHKSKNINSVLGPYGLKYRLSGEPIAMKSLVDIRIVVAEVTRSFQSDIGIEWPNEYSARIEQKLKSHNELIATLKMAEARGQGQILASPHVVARSGGEAEFLAGGELPIRILSRYSKGIQWKRHGIFLKIKPKADLDENISLSLEAEVSMPDSGYSVDNIPAMKTNRVSSQFDLKAKSTIVLSGLIQNLKSFNEQSLAGLSKIPILGEFFKSRSRRKTQTELVIFVTPEIRSNKNSKKPKAPGSWEGDFEYL